ncbi:unnamed protein product, partial [Allacma fusca]
SSKISPIVNIKLVAQRSTTVPGLIDVICRKKCLQISPFLSSNNNSVVGEDHRPNLVLPIERDPTVLRFSPLWLTDLENSYEFGFAHQFGHQLYRNDSDVVPNHNSPREAMNKCQNVSIMSFDQNRRLIQHFGYKSTLNSTIQEMLNNPRAMLFQFPEHWGETEDYHFLRSSRSGMCSDLNKLTRRRFRNLNTKEISK